MNLYILYPLYHEIMEFEEYMPRYGKIEQHNFIDDYYSKLVDTLKYSAELHVPAHYIRNYYKFWWTEEINLLKDNAIKSNKLWKDAGRPRTGPIADARNSDRPKRKIQKYVVYSDKQRLDATLTTYMMQLINKTGVIF